MPSADFCAAFGSPHGSPQSRVRDTTQISPGKFDRLPRTPAGSTPFALMDEDFAIRCPLVPAPGASYPISVRQVAVLLHAAFRPHLAVGALALR